MTTSTNDPDAIRADIEQTRSELSYNVDTLADTANPKHIASRQADKIKGAVRGVQDKIMGSPDDDLDDGAIGTACDAVSDTVAGAGDAAASVPAKAKAKTRGNPLAAGVIAFGAGLLLSSLFPATDREQQAVSTLQDNLEPVKERAGQVAQERADNLKGPAQDAAQSIKDTAGAAAEQVKTQAVDAKDTLQQQAQESAGAVKEQGPTAG